VRSRSTRSVRIVAAALVAVAIAAGCSDDPADEGSGSGTTPTTVEQDALPAPEVEGSTYVVPDDLADVRPGDLLAVETLPPVERLAGATRYRVLYASEDRSGETIAVSGVVLVPDGPAPEGGWPVVSWGHGTTGVADACAPSLTDNLFYNEYAQEVSTLLRAGYAVAATDYPGLGTPGMHSYLVGEEEGNAIVDIVTAAHQLDVALSPRWFAVGHSQGGQGVLFATQVADRADGLELAGAVAIAPASGLELALPAISAGEAPADLAYGVYMLAGLSTVDPTFRIEDVLGTAGIEHRDVLLEDGCLLDTYTRLDPDEVDRIFSMTPEQAEALSKRIAEHGNPENEPVVGPVLVVQGEADVDVPLLLTNQLVQRLAEQGSPVDYRTYPELGHDAVIGPSICDRLAWMAERGGPSVPDCAPYETDLS
jgi:pimeloyl-ACP methyl ester carboxylesterase